MVLKASGRGIRAIAATVMAALVLSGAAAVFPATPAAAVSGAGFNPGNIISDENFYDGGAMTQAQIQAFLDQRIGSCLNGKCLNVLKVTTTTRAADSNCTTYQGAANEAAAAIIYKVQTACSISAKVILVMLQKEQSLATDDIPSDGQLRAAMGMGCPDTAACDSQYYGFFNQVYAAARQLQRYNYAPFTWYPVGATTAVRYSPTESCGSAPVYIANKATAALYYYTPYQPNAAALANMGSTGDGCSSYGNRNFWDYYNTWFGPSTRDPNPIGALDLVTPLPGGARVFGWTFDYDTVDPLRIHVYVDGVYRTSFLADKVRTDVGRIYPDQGPNHGFDTTITLAQGTRSVCVYAINVGAGSVNTGLGCKTISVPSPAGAKPTGSFDLASATATGARVFGWAFDTDISGPVNVQVSVDGAVASTVSANLPRTDVLKAFPAQGANHGFDVTLPLTAGSRNICLTVVNAGPPGLDLALGCKTVVVGGAPPTAPPPTTSPVNPVGSLDLATATATGARVFGWTFDGNTRDPLTVHIYVNGVYNSRLLADKPRTDVQKAYPLQGLNTGFDQVVPLAAGVQNVCLYAINVGGGSVNTLLGCKTVTVGTVTPPAPSQPTATPVNPVGSLDLATATATGARVFGWTFDGNTRDSLMVHVYVNGVYNSWLTADKPRTDVQKAYPAQGLNTGFDQIVALSPGSQNICLYAINVGGGSVNTLLGCKTVNVPGDPATSPPTTAAVNPVGSLDLASPATGGARVFGWTFDANTRDPLRIHVYVNGAYNSWITADKPRTDVKALYPAQGLNTGFDNIVALPAGVQNVCLYAINVGAGSVNTLLGCKTVTVQ